MTASPRGAIDLAGSVSRSISRAPFPVDGKGALVLVDEPAAEPFDLVFQYPVADRSEDGLFHRLALHCGQGVQVGQHLLIPHIHDPINERLVILRYVELALFRLRLRLLVAGGAIIPYK